MNCISATNVSQWHLHKYIETYHLAIDNICLIEIVFMQSDAIHVSASTAPTSQFQHFPAQKRPLNSLQLRNNVLNAIIVDTITNVLRKSKLILLLPSSVIDLVSLVTYLTAVRGMRAPTTRHYIKIHKRQVQPDNCYRISTTYTQCTTNRGSSASFIFRIAT